MKLYHSSFQQLSILVPKIGYGRHNGEDPRAVNEPVVYLTNDDSEIFYRKGIVFPYKYTVEIDENDYELFLDEVDFEFKQEFNKVFGNTIEDSLWYFLKRPINLPQSLSKLHVFNKVPCYGEGETISVSA